MAESNKKLIVVLGATGAQGGPTARYLLAHSSSHYRVRALTRDPAKPSAVALASLGAEVVAADFNDEESVRAALAGAHAIFAITNFWDQNSFELEVAQGKLINGIASRVAGLEHYVLSALPDGRRIADGRFRRNLPYNAKAAIRDDLRENYPALWTKTTEVWVAYYYQNWVKFGLVFGPQKGPDGTWVLSMPYPSSTRVPVASSDDMGVVIDTILRGGERYYGKTVTVVGDLMPEEDRLRIWAEALGVKAVFQQVSKEEYEKRMESSGLPVHLAVAVGELCSGLPYGEAGLEANDKVIAREIIPSSYKFKTWEEYVKEEDWSPML